jgi:hypothetical protein
MLRRERDVFFASEDGQGSDLFSRGFGVGLVRECITQIRQRIGHTANRGHACGGCARERIGGSDRGSKDRRVDRRLIHVQRDRHRILRRCARRQEQHEH